MKFKGLVGIFNKLYNRNYMFRGLNYIGGEFKNESNDFTSLNPCSEQEVGVFPLTDKPEIDEAVDTARNAQHLWSKMSRIKRAEYFDVLSQLIKRDQQKLAHAISLETGKTLNESNAEVIESLHMCQVVAASGRLPHGECYASEINEKDSYVIRKPKGVVAVISPWNFPLAIGSFWSSAPAIVEGNCVVHKPSEFTPMVAQLAAELYHEAGFPAGVYNLIHGMDYTGKHLVENSVDCILFTGSAEVGMLIRQHCASTWNKTSCCELGSKSAVIVCEDANIDLAIESSVASAFKLSGQRCVSSGRILVHRSRLNEFEEKFVAKTKSLRIGDPFSKTPPDFGPLISSDAVKKVQRYNDLSREDNDTTVLLDSEQLSQPGFFVSPIVYRCEWSDKPFLKEEIFGPNVSIVPFDSVDDAIYIYNDTEYGLALGAITDDFRTMRRFRDECRVGMIYINGSSIGAESHLPFSSWGKSGYGSSAAATWKAVTHTTSITINHDNKLKFAQGMK